MNLNNKLPKLKTQTDLSDKSLWHLIQLATEKQIYWVLSRIWLNDDQKQKLENSSIWEFIKNLSYPQEANFRETLRSILSIYGLEKSRTVSVDWLKYNIGISEIFPNSNDFLYKSRLSKDFNEKIRDLWIKHYDYFRTSDILRIHTKEFLKFNFKIIKAIVSEQYSGSRFNFLKSSWLVLVNWNEIHESELISYCHDHNDDNYKGMSISALEMSVYQLGKSGKILLNAMDEDNDFLCISFEKNKASLYGCSPGTATRVA